MWLHVLLGIDPTLCILLLIRHAFILLHTLHRCPCGCLFSLGSILLYVPLKPSYHTHISLSRTSRWLLCRSALSAVLKPPLYTLTPYSIYPISDQNKPLATVKERSLGPKTYFMYTEPLLFISLKPTCHAHTAQAAGYSKGALSRLSPQPVSGAPNVFLTCF